VQCFAVRDRSYILLCTLWGDASFASITIELGGGVMIELERSIWAAGFRGQQEAVCFADFALSFLGL